MNIREAQESDLAGLLRLYTYLGKEMPDPADTKVAEIWRRIMEDPNHHVLVMDEGGALRASCVLVIVPNLTHGGRPYALIENVVTDAGYRRRGYGTAALNAAKEIAVREGCYKLMLMTGSKLESTLRFYEKAGYNRRDKTAFVQWL